MGGDVAAGPRADMHAVIIRSGAGIAHPHAWGFRTVDGVEVAHLNSVSDVQRAALCG